MKRRGEDLRFRLLTPFAAEPFSLVETGPYTQGTIFEGGAPNG